MIADDELHDYFTELVDAAGAMLYGRATYELTEDAWPAVARDERAPRAARECARKLEAKPKYVVSASRRDFPWNNTFRVEGDLHEAVKAAVAVMLFVASAACGTDDCTFEEGRRYQLDLLEPYNASSSFTFDPSLVPSHQGPACATLGDVAAGSSLTFVAERGGGEECQSLFRFETAPPTFASFQPRLDRSADNGGAAEVTIGACSGIWSIRVVGHRDTLFDRAVPGQRPPVVAQRMFTGGCAGQPPVCVDDFAGQITPR